MQKTACSTFFSTAPLAFLFLSPEGDILAANREAHTMFGHQAGILKGAPVDRILSPEISRTLPTISQKQAGECIVLECEGLRRSGMRFPLEIMACPMVVEGSRLISVILRDLREQKQMAQKLLQSELRLKLVFEQAAVGLVFQGPPGDPFLRVNSAYADMLGYSREELFSKRVEELTHPEDVEASLRLMRRVYDGRDGSDRTLEKRYIRRDGSEIWCRVTVSLARRPGGEPWFLMAVIVDISKQKQFETDLRRSLRHATRQRKRLEAILASIPDGLLILDGSDRVEEINQHFRKICPSIAGLTIGRSIAKQPEHMPPDLRNVVLRLSRTRQRVTDFQFTCRVQTGELKYLSLNGSPVEDHGTGGYVFVVRDISESRRRDCQEPVLIAESPANGAPDACELERRRILEVLHRTDGNKAKAARLLGMGRTTLYRKMTTYGL
ncbi:MAG: PAS domain S-box protein [Desulfovibrionales bacterium]